MYEVHGWFVLSAAVDDSGTAAELQRGLELVRPLVEALARAESVDARLLVLNGEHVVSVHAAPNRWRPELDVLDELLDTVAARLPGSHGTLFSVERRPGRPPGRRRPPAGAGPRPGHEASRRAAVAAGPGRRGVR